MSTVTVTLDRADAEAWLGYYREHRLTVWETRCRDALEDALDTKYGNHVSDPDLDNKPDIKLGDPTPDQESLPDEESAESDQRPSTDPCPYCGKDDCRTVEHWRDLADYWWRVAEEWADRTSDRLYEATQDRDCMEFITDRMGDRYPVRGIVMALLDWLVIHDEQGTGRAFGRWEVRDKTSDGGAGSGNGPEGRLTTVLTSPDRQGGEGPVGKGLGSSPKLESRRWAANESRQGCDEIRRELSGTSDGPVRAASAGAAAGAPPEETGSGEATAEAVVPPADLIDRAVNAIEWTCNCDREDLDLHLAVRRCAPLLIAHGREQERARWKARIKAKAAEYQAVHDEDDQYLLHWGAAADDFRSLLTEEEA